MLRGIVVDGETGKPLYLVNVLDATNLHSTTTDERGAYLLSAQDGDVISFSYTGYHTIQRLDSANHDLRVMLFPWSVRLQEYVLHPGYTPFQQDSANMSTRYSTELLKQPIKPSFSSANGGGFSGLIGAAVQKVSKSYKQNKKFKKNFQQDMEQKFIDTRYTPELTAALTGFTGDTLATFMNSYVMEYKFARTATDLEIKIWIRDNYRDYVKHGGKPAPAKNPED